MPFIDRFTDFSQFQPTAFIAAAKPFLRAEPGLLVAKAAALKEKAREEISRAQAISKNAETADEGAGLSDRDQRRIDKLRTTAEELTAWAEELEAAETEMSKPMARLSEPEPADGDRTTLIDRGRRRAPRGSFRALFNAPVASPWKTPAEFLAVVSSNRFDPRLNRPQAAGNISIGSDGGFLVPTELYADILDAALGMELIRPLARVFPMTSSSLHVAAPDRLDRSGGSVGGFEGQWLDEGQEADQQTPKFSRLILEANKLAVFAQASIEAEMDAVDFQGTMTSTMSESLAFTLDGAFINGNGVGRPLGLLRAPNIIIAPKQASQAAATITYRNVIDMAARLTPGSWRRAVWLASQTTLPELFRLNFQARTDAGAVIPDEAVAAPVFAVSATGEYLLLGRPLLITEHCETLGAQGDLCLADLNEYAIGLRAEAFLERSNAPGWTKGFIDYRLIIRVDGRPRYGAAVKPAKGVTVSPFVVLAAR